ncbi:hypothetical protein F2Q70_00036112 [Brassica cretica]|uniref:Uncharacterized protein n=1 Tax=Brassica cretica TaxID=69181 RepID=A0A8S9JXD9_BRACR|nr:hypothetical protein F2Q70_00036112 [Brassica cretica]
MDGVDLIRVLLELISALRLRRPVLVGSQSCLKYIAPSLYKTAITVAHTLISTVTTYLLSTSEETPIFNDWINGLQTLYRPRDCVCPMVFTRGSSLDGRKYINKSLMILGNVINKLSESSKLRYMPSSTRSNKVTQFSPDLVSLERSICKKAHSSSIDINTRVSLDSAQPPSIHTPVPSTDTRSPLSTDNAHLLSTDIFHPTSIDIPSRTSIDTEQRDMVVPLILVRDNNGDLHDQEGHLHNAAVPVDFHVLDIKLNWNSSLLLGRAFLSTVGAVFNLQTNQLCLTLIDPNAHYDPIPVKKPQTISRRINDPRIIAACHCGAEYETDYPASIDTRHQQSINTRHQQSIDNNNATSIDNRPIPKTTVSEKDKIDNQYLTPDEFGIFKDPDGYVKAIDGPTLHVSREDIADIFQTANGADNLFMHQRSNPEQKATKEFYDTAGGINNSFIQRSPHTTQPSTDVDVPTSVDRQPEFGDR